MGTSKTDQGVGRPRENRFPGLRRALGWVLLWSAVTLSGFGVGQALAQNVENVEEVIAGTYNIDELKRLLEIAEESGFTEEHLRNVTVEDEQGNVINAWTFIRDYEKKKKEEEARLAAERAKKYLTPHDIMAELDGKQPHDIEDLRDNLLWVE
jgi:hypothetical protein